MPETTAINAKALLNDVKTFATYADRQITNGDFVDLKQFEEKLRTLCSAILTLPSEEAEGYKPELQSLINMLSSWSGILEERKESLKRNVQDLNTQIRAQKAYITTNNAAPEAPISSKPSESDN